MNTERKIPDRIDYLKCKKHLNDFGITDEEINKALDNLGITKKDLCEEIGFKNEGQTPYGNTWEEIGRGTIYLVEYKDNGFEKRYRRTGMRYLIPHQYQGLKHGDIIFEILKNKFEWFPSFKVQKFYEESPVEEYFDTIGRLDVNRLPEEFKKLSVQELLNMNSKIKITKEESGWNLYEMSSSDHYELYLRTEFGSLYVPFKALMNKDWKAIEHRMKTYALSYHDPINLSGYALNHRGRTKEQYAEDKKEDFNKMIKPLESKEALTLKSYFDK